MGLIERIVEEMYRQGRQATVESWLEKLPEEALWSKPDLCLWQAWGLLITGQLEKYEFPLRIAEQVWQAESNLPKLAQADVIRSMLAYYKEDVETAIALTKNALEALAESDVFHRSVANLVLGACCGLNGEVTKAITALMASVAGSRAIGHLNCELAALEELGYVRILQGKLRAAIETYQEVIQRSDIRFQHQAMRARIGTGLIHREWNDLEAAQRHLEEALEIDRLTGFGQIWLWLYFEVGRLNAARGERQQAMDDMNRAIAVAEKFGNRRMVSEANAYRARLWLAQDNLEAAAKWATESALRIDGDL